MAKLQSIKQRFGIIGRSKLLDRALETAVRIANTDISVLITGESGVGKEVFSKIIHSLSHRKHNKFIPVNCGAIPEGTINSELFGHEKGAFTGSAGERKGYFETVNGGTIFLDEIGEMPLETQAFLLRILESGEFLKVGSSTPQTTDVRVIAATNVDLTERIRKGRFREDLYYRLNTVHIKVPALRERPEDILMLFRKFTLDAADKYRANIIQLDDKARLLLKNYTWPGNVRELKNLAEQVTVLANNPLVTAEELLEFNPQLMKRHLPMIPDAANGDSSPLPEREILYKFLFDMKKDLSDLKSLVFELIRTNDLNVPDVSSFQQLKTPALARPSSSSDYPLDFEEFVPEQNHHTEFYPPPSADSNRPIIIDPNERQYEQTEVVEENLNMADHEKELIRKALKKHNNRRKDAASDLGISERTLYRKIKQYDL